MKPRLCEHSYSRATNLVLVDMVQIKETLEKGAKEAVSTDTLLGVVAVLASGTVISSYMGLFGGSRTVRMVALGALTAGLFGYATVGGEGMGTESRKGLRAFTGTLGLMSLVALVREVLMGGSSEMESQVYPVGEGRIIGSMTSEDTFSPIGTVSNNAESFAAEGVPQDESPSWNPIDMGQYNPMDAHTQDMGYAPPVWMGDEVPEVSEQPKTAHAGNVNVGGTVVGSATDAIKSYLVPSNTVNSAGFTGNGVPEAFYADSGEIGNMMKGAEGFGRITGQ